MVDETALSRLLDRIEASGVLGRSERRRRLLRYLVEAEQAGRGDAIKGYSIGIDVLGRAPDFDPSADSIVRVEIARLRDALELYRATAAEPGAPTITIPKGSYRPHIEAGTPPAPEATKARPRAASGLAQRLLALPRWRLGVLGAALVAIAALATAGLWPRQNISLPATNPDAGVPIVEVRPFAAYGITDEALVTRGVREQLIIDLNHLRNVRVRESVPGPLPPDARAADFRLEGLATADEENVHLLVKLVDPKRELIVWSRSLTLPTSDAQFYDAMRDTVGAIAFEIAGQRGVVAMEALRRFDRRAQRLSEDDSSEYVCLLRSYVYDATKDAAQGTLARACLTRLVEIDSLNSSIWAQHALMYFFSWIDQPDHADSARLLEEGLRAARRAVEIDPHNALGFERLGTILSVKGERTASVAAYERALELTPYKPSLSFLLGWQVVLMGDWEGGIAMVRKGVDLIPFAPGYMRIPLVLDAFRRGAYDESLTGAQAVIQLGDDRGVGLAFAAALALGERALAERYLGELQAVPGFDAADPFRSVRNSYSNPSIMAEYDAVARESGLLPGG
ncbi:MAG: hypothetical protein AAGI34_06895 [Pseudomonadota bacterium]